MAASAAEQRALLGGVPRASGLEPPPCIPVGAVCSPTLLSIPPNGLQRSLCTLPTLHLGECCVGFQSPAPVPHPSECPPPTASRSLSDPRGAPPLLLTDGLVLGVCGWAGAEEETLCQGEKVGCCGWGSGGVRAGVTCSVGPCPRALGLRPLWEVGNQPRPGLGPGTEARPRGRGAHALHVGFRRREGSLGSWCVSVRDIEKEGNGLNECTWVTVGVFFH